MSPATGSVRMLRSVSPSATLPFGLVADHDQFVGRTLRVDALFAQRAERLAAETRRCDGKHDGQFYYSFHRFYTFLCEERADAGAGDRPVQTEIRSLQRWCKSRTASDAIRTTGRAAASCTRASALAKIVFFVYICTVIVF